MSRMYKSRNFLITGVLLVLRIILITVTWIIARQSYVFDIGIGIKSDLLGAPPFAIGLLFTVAKAGAGIVIEILFTTDLEKVTIEEISKPTTRRLLYANGVLFLAELTFLVNLLIELDELQAIRFVLTIITSGSLLGLLLNPSMYPIFWLGIVLYGFGIAIYLIPRAKDEQQAATDKASVMLFLRSLILPV